MKKRYAITFYQRPKLKKLLKSVLKKERIFNLIYRVITIVLKFLLSIIIVKYLSVYDLGVYGIFQTTVTLLIYVLGYDFYTYNAREILKKESENISIYIGNQFLFHGFVYLLVLPLSLLLFFYNVVATEHLIYFYLILLTEHISQEIYRILIVLKKSVMASFTLFLRAGLWILALYILWKFDFTSKAIKDILILWIIGASVSIIVGIFQIPFKLKFKIDLDWIKKGIKVATPFFIATIFYKIIEFSGRYFVDFYWTKEEVGVFTFFAGISNALFILVQSTVIIVMSPYLIENANKGLKEFKEIFKDYKKQILYVTAIGFLLAIICIYPLLLYLGNDLLSQNLLVFFVLLLAVSFFCFSYIPHYGLYSFHKDKELLWASLLGAIVNIVANFTLVPKYGALGAAFAQVLSMLSLFLLKGFLFKRISNG